MKNLILNNPNLREITLSDWPDYTIVYDSGYGLFQLMYRNSDSHIVWTTESLRQNIQDQITMLIEANQETDSDI